MYMIHLRMFAKKLCFLFLDVCVATLSRQDVACDRLRCSLATIMVVDGLSIKTNDDCNNASTHFTANAPANALNLDFMTSLLRCHYRSLGLLGTCFAYFA